MEQDSRTSTNASASSSSTSGNEPQEFRRYRQVLASLYVGVLGVGALLVLASIVAELFFRRGERGPVPSPADLVQCNRDVRSLLEELGSTAASLQGDAFRGHGAEVSGKWDEFTRSWQQRWEVVNDRCQFDRLADTGLGPAYDRMAWVHRNLPTVKLKYRELMKRFTDELSGEVAAMWHALDKSEHLLLQRAVPPPTTQPARETNQE